MKLIGLKSALLYLVDVIDKRNNVTSIHRQESPISPKIKQPIPDKFVLAKMEGVGWVEVQFRKSKRIIDVWDYYYDFDRCELWMDLPKED